MAGLPFTTSFKMDHQTGSRMLCELSKERERERRQIIVFSDTLLLANSLLAVEGCLFAPGGRVGGDMMTNERSGLCRALFVSWLLSELARRLEGYRVSSD